MRDLFKWLRGRGVREAEPVPAPDPDATIAQLRGIISDAAVEEVLDDLELCREEVIDEIADAVRERTLGAFPLHTATLWLTSTAADLHGTVPEWLEERVADSVVWAIGFESNPVLIGVALASLDGLPASRRAQVAREAFDRLGPDSARRFWLLMKERGSDFVGHVFEALDDFAARHPWVPPADPDADDGVVPTAGPRGKMAGAFRQFEATDIDVLLEHASLDNAGADFLVDAIASTGSSRGKRFLERAARDERPHVSSVARRHLDRGAVG